MAAGFLRYFQCCTKSSNLGRVRYINDLVNSPCSSKRKKLLDTVFLLGFGLAGFVVFAGLNENRKQRTSKATSTGGESDEQKKHPSRTNIPVSYYCIFAIL